MKISRFCYLYFTFFANGYLFYLFLLLKITLFNYRSNEKWSFNFDLLTFLNALMASRFSHLIRICRYLQLIADICNLIIDICNPITDI